jgi:hypothetical protein
VSAHSEAPVTRTVTRFSQGTSAGLAMARTASGARLYLIGGGAIYLVLYRR